MPTSFDTDWPIRRTQTLLSQNTCVNDIISQQHRSTSVVYRAESGSVVYREESLARRNEHVPSGSIDVRASHASSTSQLTVHASQSAHQFRVRDARVRSFAPQHEGSFARFVIDGGSSKLFLQESNHRTLAYTLLVSARISRRHALLAAMSPSDSARIHIWKCLIPTPGAVWKAGPLQPAVHSLKRSGQMQRAWNAFRSLMPVL